jgi:hypothetical protein
MADETETPRPNRAHRQTMRSYLRFNGILIEIWTEALEQISEWNSPAAEAIRKHLDALVDFHRCALADPHAKPDPEDDFNQLVYATWHHVEATLPHETLSEVSRRVGDLWEHSCLRSGTPGDAHLHVGLPGYVRRVTEKRAPDGWYAPMRNALLFYGIMIEAWSETLERTTESEAAGAIREHLEVLLDSHRHVLTKPQERNPEDNRRLNATWGRIEAILPPKTLSEIGRHISELWDLFGLRCGIPSEEHGHTALPGHDARLTEKPAADERDKQRAVQLMKKIECSVNNYDCSTEEILAAFNGLYVWIWANERADVRKEMAGSLMSDIPGMLELANRKASEQTSALKSAFYVVRNESTPDGDSR